jgi:hypothetical protein
MGVGGREKHRSSTYATAAVSNPNRGHAAAMGEILGDAGGGERRYQLELLRRGSG